MHVVQIWIMHINALKTRLMYRNVQTNPKKSQKFTQHSSCSMLTRETKIESNKRQWISFCPQRWDVPYRNPPCLLWEAPVCEKHIPKPAPNGTIFLPRPVGAAPWTHAKFHEFQTGFGFTRITKASTSTFSEEPRCRGVRNSSPFLAWDIRINPWIHIWFYKPMLLHRRMCM